MVSSLDLRAMIVGRVYPLYHYHAVFSCHLNLCFAGRSTSAFQFSLCPLFRVWNSTETVKFRGEYEILLGGFLLQLPPDVTNISIFLAAFQPAGELKVVGFDILSIPTAYVLRVHTNLQSTRIQSALDFEIQRESD